MSENPTIKVAVKTQYIEEQSKPDQQQYVYAYTIRISNDGDCAAKLISRHWYITDAKDQTQEVQGMGVVGEQPMIEPNESYTYTSGVVMETATGTMHGTYTLEKNDGEEFTTKIPTFALVQPQALH